MDAFKPMASSEMQGPAQLQALVFGSATGKGTINLPFRSKGAQSDKRGYCTEGQSPSIWVDLWLFWAHRMIGAGMWRLFQAS